MPYLAYANVGNNDFVYLMTNVWKQICISPNDPLPYVFNIVKMDTMNVVIDVTKITIFLIPHLGKDVVTILDGFIYPN